MKPSISIAVKSLSAPAGEKIPWFE